MTERMKIAGLSLAAGVAATVGVAGVIGLFVVYSGSFNVAATEEHASVIRWAFDTTFRNSVERRAGDAAAPEQFTPAMIAAGGTVYKTTCQHCHAGPGVERAAWAAGMRPRPPHLAEAAAEWEIEEVFWLVKHGVKMTGMPAFGPALDDRTIWSIAGFVKQLPAMAPERYAELGGDGRQPGGHGGSTH